jgi:hypothetical protein
MGACVGDHIWIVVLLSVGDNNKGNEIYCIQIEKRCLVTKKGSCLEKRQIDNHKPTESFLVSFCSYKSKRTEKLHPSTLIQESNHSSVLTTSHPASSSSFNLETNPKDEKLLHD